MVDGAGLGLGKALTYAPEETPGNVYFATAEEVEELGRWRGGEAE